MSATLKERLRRTASSSKPPPNDCAKTEDELFEEAYLALRYGDATGQGRPRDPLIPPLVRPLPDEGDILRQKLREEAR